MKKKLVLALAAALSVGLLAGCGSDTASESGTASSEATADASGDIVYNALDYVTLGDYMNITVEATQYTVSDADVEEYVQNILSSNAYHKEITDRTTVEDGDYLDVAYTLTVDGEEEDSGDDLTFTVGDGSMIDDFNDAMIGATVGEEFEFDAVFPDDYSDDLGGKTGHFVVTVNSISESDTSVPELTDEWVEETYGDSMSISTVDEFYDEVRDYLEEQADSNTESSKLTAIQDAVYACCTVNSVPDGLIEEKVNEYIESDKAAAESYGYDFEDYIYQCYGYSSEDDYRADLEEYMADYVNKLLVREAIIENEGWEVTDEDIDAFLLQYANYYNYETFDDFLAAYGASYGFSTKEEFIAYVGEDQVNDAALTVRLWDEIEAAATVNYVSDDASGDASADATVED